MVILSGIVVSVIGFAVALVVGRALLAGVLSLAFGRW
jgi:hypothetical protein